MNCFHSIYTQVCVHIVHCSCSMHCVYGSHLDCRHIYIKLGTTHTACQHDVSTLVLAGLRACGRFAKSNQITNRAYPTHAPERALHCRNTIMQRTVYSLAAGRSLWHGTLSQSSDMPLALAGSSADSHSTRVVPIWLQQARQPALHCSGINSLTSKTGCMPWWALSLADMMAGSTLGVHVECWSAHYALNCLLVAK